MIAPMVWLARIYGALWIAADFVNCWKVLLIVMDSNDAYQRVGAMIWGLVSIPTIFYCGLQVAATTRRIVPCLKVLLVMGFLPVLMRRLVPVEILAWLLLELWPSVVLIRGFSKPPAGTQI